MNRLSISHPTGRENFTVVYLGAVALTFSYETLIGYAPARGDWVLAENTWGPTTGKHLNHWSTDKSKRVPWEEMHQGAVRELSGFGLADLEAAADNAMASLRSL